MSSTHGKSLSASRQHEPIEVNSNLQVLVKPPSAGARLDAGQPRMVCTSGNDQGSLPADNCTESFQQEGTRVAESKEHAHDGSTENPVQEPEEHVCAFRAAVSENPAKVAMHLKDFALKSALGDIGRKYSDPDDSTYEASEVSDVYSADLLPESNLDQFESSICSQPEEGWQTSKQTATVEQLDNGGRVKHPRRPTLYSSEEERLPAQQKPKKSRAACPDSVAAEFAHYAQNKIRELQEALLNAPGNRESEDGDSVHKPPRDRRDGKYLLDNDEPAHDLKEQAGRNPVLPPSERHSKPLLKNSHSPPLVDGRRRSTNPKKSRGKDRGNDHRAKTSIEWADHHVKKANRKIAAAQLAITNSTRSRLESEKTAGHAKNSMGGRPNNSREVSSRSARRTCLPGSGTGEVAPCFQTAALAEEPAPVQVNQRRTSTVPDLPPTRGEERLHWEQHEHNSVNSGFSDLDIQLAIKCAASEVWQGFLSLHQVLHVLPPATSIGCINNRYVQIGHHCIDDFSNYLDAIAKHVAASMKGRVPAYALLKGDWRGKITDRLEKIDREQQRLTARNGRLKPTAAPILAKSRTRQPSQNEAELPEATVLARRPIFDHPTNSCENGGTTGMRHISTGQTPARTEITEDTHNVSIPPPPIVPQRAQAATHSSHFENRRHSANTFDLATETLTNRMSSDESHHLEALDLAYESTSKLEKSAKGMAMNCHKGRPVDGRAVMDYCQGSADCAKQVCSQILGAKLAAVRHRDLNSSLAREMADNARNYVKRDIPEVDQYSNCRSSAGYIRRAQSDAHHSPLPSKQTLCPLKLHGVYRWYAHQISESLPFTLKHFLASDHGSLLSEQTSKLVATAYWRRTSEDAHDVSSQATAFIRNPSYYTQVDLNYEPHVCTDRYSSMVSSSSNPGMWDPKATRPPSSKNPRMSQSLEIRSETSSRSRTTDMQTRTHACPSEISGKNSVEPRENERENEHNTHVNYGDVYSCATICGALHLVLHGDASGSGKYVCSPRLWKYLGYLVDEGESTNPKNSKYPYWVKYYIVARALELALLVPEPTKAGSEQSQLWPRENNSLLEFTLSKNGVPPEEAMEWLKQNQDRITTAITDNVQKALDGTTPIPLQLYKMLKASQKEFLQAKLQARSSTGPENSTQAIILAIQELRSALERKDGNGYGVGAWNIIEMNGGSGRQSSTRKTVQAVIRAMFITKFRTHLDAAESGGVKLRSYMSWKKIITTMVNDMSASQKSRLTKPVQGTGHPKIPYGENIELTYHGYTWAVPIRELNRLYHALHGNGTTNKSITKKMDVTNIPILKSTDTTAEKFVLWTIDLRAWCKINLIEGLVLNRVLAAPHPAGTSPNLGEYLNSAGDLAEGLRYLCAAIEDIDLQNGVSTNGLIMSDVLATEIRTAATEGRDPNMSVQYTNAKGHLGFDWLEEEFLQGAQIQPIMQDILDSLELCPTKGIVSFKAKFKKIADCLEPPMPPAILSQKFNTSILRGTGSLYQNCITSASSGASKTDFKAYSMLLCRLIQEVHAASCDSEKAETALAAKFAKKALSARELPDPRSRPERNPSARGGASKSRAGNTKINFGCARCGSKDHHSNKCHLKKMECNKMLPNGQLCKRDHKSSSCWYDDPEKCPDPKVKQLILAKLESWRTTSRTAMTARSGEYLDEDDTYGESAQHAKCGSCQGEITNTEWEEISPENWDTTWELVNRKIRHQKRPLQADTLKCTAPPEKNIKALMARIPKAISTPHRQTPVETRSRTSSEYMSLSREGNTEIDDMDTGTESPPPSGASGEPPRVVRQPAQRCYPTLDPPTETSEVLAVPGTITPSLKSDAEGVPDSPMTDLFYHESDPDALTIYNKGWGEPVGLVTNGDTASIGGIPEYVQLGKTQNMNIYIPYPQLRYLLIATRLCLQTDPHDPGGCARKAVLALLIQLGAGSAKSDDARALSAAIIKAARPNSYDGFHEILVAWDIDILLLRYWDNVVMKLLRSESGLLASQSRRTNYKPLPLKSIPVNPESVARANLRLQFMNLAVPILPFENRISDLIQELPDLGHIFADVRADPSIERKLHLSFGRIPSPFEIRRNEVWIDRLNWCPGENATYFETGLLRQSSLYKSWPHHEEPFCQTHGTGRQEEMAELLELATSHKRIRQTATCARATAAVKAFTAVKSGLNADCWQIIATDAILQSTDWTPSRVSEICKEAKRGQDNALEKAVSSLSQTLQPGDAMQIIDQIFEKMWTERAKNSDPSNKSLALNKLSECDLYCEEPPIEYSEGVRKYTRHLLDTGQYSRCVKDMCCPITFSEDMTIFLKGNGDSFPTYKEQPSWNPVRAMIGTIKAFGIQSYKDTLGAPGEIFIDTGCSDHLCSDKRCLINPESHKKVRIPIETANGISMAESQGPAVFTVKDSSGGWINIQRTVLYCPNLTVNLFSPSKDFEVHGTRVAFNDECILTLTNGTKIPFIRQDNTYKLTYKIQKEQALAAKAFQDDTLMQTWHRRLGHLPPSTIMRASVHSVGMPDMTSYSPDFAIQLKRDCTSCPVSNQKQNPHRHNAKRYEKLVKSYGDRIHMDLAGPIELSLNGGFKYASTFIDEYTLHIGVYCIRAKSDQIRAHKNYVADMAYAGSRDIKEFHSDNGGEYISKDYKELILENGARKSTIVPKSPNMNPIAEGTFWRLFSVVRAMLKDSGLPNSHWARAIYQAAYVLNRMPNSKTDLSPYEALQGRKPEMRHIKIFGCLAYGLKPKHDRSSKLDDVADIGYHVGVARYQRGWVLFIPDKNDPIRGKYKVYRTVHFNESVLYRDQITTPVPQTFQGVMFGHPAPGNTENEENDSPNLNPLPDGTIDTTLAEDGSEGDGEGDHPPSDDSGNDSPPPVRPTQIPKPKAPATPRLKGSHTYKPPMDVSFCGLGGCTKKAGHSDNHNGTSFVPDVEGLPSGNLRPRKRAQSAMVGVDIPSTTEKYELNLEILDNAETDRHNKVIRAFIATKKRFRDEDNNLTIEIFVPTTYEQAISCPDAEHWKKAMSIEMESHLKSGTWELISALNIKKGKKTIGSTWAFDVKRRADGTIERYKARLCAQGFSQIFGHDYNVTYSNTVRYSTLRTLFSVAASRNYLLHGADVKTAYLNGFIEDGSTIYMRQAKGYQETDPDGNGQVCLLKRSIYGLKQSGLCWEVRLAAHLESMGFERCEVDKCLYKVTRDSGTMYMCVYVDDLCMASSSEAIHTEIMEEIQKTFETKDTGPLTWVFGTAIIQNLEKGTVTVSQKLYAEDTCTQLKDMIDKLATTRSRSIPCADEISNLEILQPGELIDPEYRSVLGKLGWMNMISRPDVAFVYSMLSRHAATGGERHMAAMANALKYLSKTSGYVLTYKRDGCDQFHQNITKHSDFRCDTLTDESITTFTDSSHGGERPMAGYTIMIGGTPIDWRAYRSKVTPLSSCQAEYCAASTAVVATLGTRGVGKFFGISDAEPTVVFCDNKAAVQLSDGDSSSKKMMHIATRIAFLREQVQEKLILLYHIKTEGQIADIFTKPLSPSVFHSFRQLLVHGPG